MSPWQASLYGIASLIAAALTWRGIWFAHVSRRWPTAPAKILYIGMAGSQKRNAYHVEVRYSYTVDAVTYESTRWRFGWRETGSLQQMTYAMSTEIEPVNPVAFYDPSRPARSCLVPGRADPTLAGAIIFTTLAATMLVIFFRG